MPKYLKLRTPPLISGTVLCDVTDSQAAWVLCTSVHKDASVPDGFYVSDSSFTKAKASWVSLREKTTYTGQGPTARIHAGNIWALAQATLKLTVLGP